MKLLQEIRELHDLVFSSFMLGSLASAVLYFYFAIYKNRTKNNRPSVSFLKAGHLIVITQLSGFQISLNYDETTIYNEKKAKHSF